MPLPPTPNMGLVRPTELGDAGLWGSLVNTIFSQLDLHDHSSGRGVQVPSAGLNINGDVAWGTNSLTGMAALKFTPVSGTVGGAFVESLFTGDGTGATIANELYWTSSDGTLVKLTDGHTLNVAAFTGGIVGDYSVVGAIVTYDSATKRYKFETSTADGHGWARLMTGGVRLGILNNTNNSFYVEHAVNAAIATAYTVTWPATQAAAAGTLVQLDSSGVVTFGNTGLAASTFTGLITASAGLTAASNQSITVQGTGDYKHGTKTIQLSAVDFAFVDGLNNLGSGRVSATGGVMLVLAGVPLRVGDRITAIRFRGADSTTGPTKFQGSFGPDGGAAAGSTAISAGNAAAQTLAITSGLPVTLSAGTPYWVQFATQTGTNFTRFDWCEIDYDRP